MDAVLYPINHASPAGVRWSHRFVPGVRSLPSSLYLDSVLDVVGVLPLVLFMVSTAVAMR